MLLLIQARIILEVPVSLLPSVSGQVELLLRASRHMVYVAWTQVMVLYELVDHSSTTILILWLQIHPYIWSLKDCNHLITNHCSLWNDQVVEWSDRFRVTSKHNRTTENQSTSDHLLIMCEVIATITEASEITCADWSYQIIPKFITDGLSIWSSKSSDVLFHCFQSLGGSAVGTTSGSLWSSSMYFRWYIAWNLYISTSACVHVRTILLIFLI